MPSTESTRILPGLHQGSRPPLGGAVSADKFDVLILAAREFQPSAEFFPGVFVIHVPMDDAQLTQDEFTRANQAADLAFKAYKNGARILVTCLLGLNRSGLVMALLLHRITGISGEDAIALIRSRRRMALWNRSFVRALRSIEERVTI